jgi:outer membrane translocation and assembly module TamA
MFNINAELRFPVYKDILSGVVFNDIGALSCNGFKDLCMNHIAGATGCGIRYATPVGPLRFDMGWKWSKRSPDDNPYAWYITFGHTF